MLRLSRLLPALLVLLVAQPRALAQYENEGPDGLAVPPVATHPLTPPSPAANALPTPAQTARAYADPTTVAAPSAPPAGSAVALRLDMLDGQLSSLGARRNSGVGDGVVTMLLGGTYIGLGVYANRNGGGPIATYFYLAGAGSLASSAVHFGLQPNAERAYTRFQSLAGDPNLDPNRRLELSEDILHSMAKRRMAARFVQAGINLGITVGSIPVLLGNDGFSSSSGLDWIIVASSGIGVVNAITTMIQRTEEERRWRMYRQFADNHPTEGITSDSRPRLRLDTFAVAPSPAGGIAVARFVF